MAKDKTEAQIISDEVGFSTAAVMCELWGGKTLYVPDKPSPLHPIAQDIGEDKLSELCDVFGSQTIHLPKLDCARLARQKRKAHRLLIAGFSRVEIAHILEVSTETVRLWLVSMGGGK